MSGSRAFAASLLCISLVGCYDEQIPEQDLDGQIVLAGDMIDDPRDAGLIYLGIYEGYDPEQLGYPYPTTGPRVGDNPIGDALPYGGTTVGAYAYACYRVLRCQVVTGRYDSLEALLETNPVEEEEVLANTEDLYDQCSWYYGWNSLREFSFIGTDQMDFVQDSAGDWVADFRAWHTRLPAGAILWAFADNDFTTCSPDQGRINRRRSEDGQYFREGSNFNDILNFPDKYITEGDFLSQDVVTIEADKASGYSLRIDYRME
jgi:hypothetical protein